MKELSKRFRFLFLGIFFTFSLFNAHAQSIISGVVVDQQEGLPMEGVAVVSRFMNTGVLTDYRGRYSIRVADNDTLRVSYLGYQDQVFPIHGGWNTYYTINISLAILPTNLKELKFSQSRNFIDDSILFRSENRFIFEDIKPKVVSYYLPVPNYDLTNQTYLTGYEGPQFSGGISFSVNSFYDRLINSRGKRLTHFKKILMAKEKETFVYRHFNPQNVHDITGLVGEELKEFMKLFTPKFKTLLEKTDYEIDVQIKKSYLRYKENKANSLKMNL